MIRYTGLIGLIEKQLIQSPKNTEAKVFVSVFFMPTDNKPPQIF